MDKKNTLALPGNIKDSIGLMILNKRKLVATVVCLTLGRCKHGMTEN